MPVVFRQGRVKFHFYSHEGQPREPAHVHVKDGFEEAKFWLRPEVALAYNTGIKARDLARHAALVEERREEIERRWDEHVRD